MATLKYKQMQVFFIHAGEISTSMNKVNLPPRPAHVCSAKVALYVLMTMPLLSTQAEDYSLIIIKQTKSI